MMNQDGMLIYSDQKSFMKVDEDGFELKGGDFETTTADIKNDLLVTGSLQLRGVAEIEGGIKFPSHTAMGVGTTAPQAKFHVTESYASEESFAQKVAGTPFRFPTLRATGNTQPWAPDQTGGYISTIMAEQESYTATTNNADVIIAALGAAPFADSYRIRQGVFAGTISYGGGAGGWTSTNASNRYYTGSLAMGMGNSFSAQSRFFGSDIQFETGEAFDSSATAAIQFDAYINRTITRVEIDSTTNVTSGAGFSLMGFTHWPRGRQDSPSMAYVDDGNPIKASSFSMWNTASGSYGAGNGHFLFSYGHSPSHMSGPLSIWSGSAADEDNYLPSGTSTSTNKSRQFRTIPSASIHIRKYSSLTRPDLIITNESTGDASLTFELANADVGYSLGADHSDSDKFKINTHTLLDNPVNAGVSAGVSAIEIDTSQNVSILNGTLTAGNIDADSLRKDDNTSTSIDLADEDISINVDGDEKASFEDNKIIFSDYLQFGSATVDDPASDESVNIGNSDGGTNADVFRIYSNDGYTDIGAKTTSFSFFNTDRAGFFFQKSAIFDDQSTDSNLGVAGVMSQDSDFYVRRDYDDTSYTQIALKSTTIDFHVNTSTAEFQMQADGDFHADGDIIAYSTSVSDRRLKTNFVEIKPKEALEKLLSLQGYEFEWKHKDDGTHYGVIAQDLLEVLPHAVVEKKLPFYDGTKDEHTDIYKEEWKKEQGIEDDKYYTARYEEIIPVMIEGMKELNQKISKLEKEVEELKNGNKNR